MSNLRRVIAFVPNIMDRSRFAGLSEGTQVVFISRIDELNEVVDNDVNLTADLIVLDLNKVRSFSTISELKDVHIVGFAAHVDRDLMENARNAGVQEVLPRSRFFAKLREIVDE